jgi:hypothetical protein
MFQRETYPEDDQDGKSARNAELQHPLTLKNDTGIDCHGLEPETAKGKHPSVDY